MSVGCSQRDYFKNAYMMFELGWTVSIQVHYGSILQSDSHFSEWCGGTLYPLSSQHACFYRYYYQHSSHILLLLLYIPLLLTSYLSLLALRPYPTPPLLLPLPTTPLTYYYPYSFPFLSLCLLLPLPLLSYPYCYTTIVNPAG